MTNTNEDIALAAGLNWPLLLIASTQGSETLKIEPDWRSDPGAVATWLLPVLEKRWPKVEFNRDKLPGLAQWLVYEDFESEGDCFYDCAPTWHEAVINGILATREDK